MNINQKRNAVVGPDWAVQMKRTDVQASSQPSDFNTGTPKRKLALKINTFAQYSFFTNTIHSAISFLTTFLLYGP
jgi:hypothetical protein